VASHFESKYLPIKLTNESFSERSQEQRVASRVSGEEMSGAKNGNISYEKQQQNIAQNQSQNTAVP
jgi:hypothetical protein